MLKHCPKLKKLWKNMEKKVSKKKGSIMSFDKRFKETKEFTKEFCDIMIEQFKKISVKERKQIDGLLNYVIKGRTKRKSDTIKK